MSIIKALIIIGSAPYTREDIAALPAGLEYHAMLIGLDSVDKYPGHALYFATYHPGKIPETIKRRRELGGNVDFRIICHEAKHEGVSIVIPFKPPSGSSALLGVLAGAKLGYTKMILCGCPLENEQRDGQNKNYDQFRDGWKSHLDLYVGKVRSQSGWTREFLGAPTEQWLQETA